MSCNVHQHITKNKKLQNIKAEITEILGLIRSKSAHLLIYELDSNLTEAFTLTKQTIQTDYFTFTQMMF